jgi:hypothetical protein
MKYSVIFAMAIFLTVSGGCDSNEGIDINNDDIGLVGNLNGKRNLLIEKAGLSEAQFSIEEVRFNSTSRDTLDVTVLHPANCDGKFEFYWDGSIALSYPAHVYLVLKYVGRCETSELTTRTTISLDLDKFLTHPDIEDNTIIRVINGSVTHASNDKNVPSNE